VLEESMLDFCSGSLDTTAASIVGGGMSLLPWQAFRGGSLGFDGVHCSDRDGPTHYDLITAGLADVERGRYPGRNGAPGLYAVSSVSNEIRFSDATLRSHIGYIQERGEPWPSGHNAPSLCSCPPDTLEPWLRHAAAGSQVRTLLNQRALMCYCSPSTTGPCPSMLCLLGKKDETTSSRHLLLHVRSTPSRVSRSLASTAQTPPFLPRVIPRLQDAPRILSQHARRRFQTALGGASSVYAASSSPDRSAYRPGLTRSATGLSRAPFLRVIVASWIAALNLQGAFPLSLPFRGLHLEEIAQPRNDRDGCERSVAHHIAP
jgi:hypothetical protein